MPILFEAPEPFSPAISQFYGRSQAGFQPDARPGIVGGGGGGGYGGGGGGGGQGDIQDAINNRDANAIRQNQFAATLEPQGRDVFQANAAADQDRQRFELQAQLQSVELSQQEKIRLQRMKNAIGAVSTDPTLADHEKAEMILQLRTGIDPLERRMAQQRLQTEKVQKEAMIENTQAQAATRQNIAKFQALSFEDLHRNVPHAQAIAQFVDDINTATPGLPEEEVNKRARARAIREGAYTTWVQTAPNKWEKQEGPGAEGMGHFEKGKGGSSPGDQKPPKELDDVGALRQAKARLEASGATVDDKDWADKLSKAVTEVKAENRGRIDGAKGGGKPPELPPEVKRAKLEQISQEVESYKQRTDLDPQVRDSAVAVSRQVFKFIEKYGSPDHFPPAVKAQYEQYRKFMDTVPKAPQEQPLTAGEKTVKGWSDAAISERFGLPRK